jgi:alkylation response protein AidB-like acyl-CoA dehydrogenase
MSSDFIAQPLTLLNSEDQLFFDTVKEFAKTTIGPMVNEMDEKAFIPRSLVDSFFDMGLMSMEIPESFGGSQASFFKSILAIEAISQTDASLALVVDGQNTLFLNSMLGFGTPEQKAYWLPKIVSEKQMGCYCLTEPGSGSDAFALKTQAIDCGDHYEVTGQKIFITNATFAQYFLVFATEDSAAGYKGITALLLDKDMPGLVVGRKEDKLGIRANPTCVVNFDKVKVPKFNVMGKPRQGYKIAMSTLNEGRIGVAAQMLGLAQGALDYAINYTKDRKQFGQSLHNFQGIQFDIAKAATKIECARLLTYNAARLKEAGKDFAKEGAMCKYYSSIIAEEVASLCVELLGGYGFIKEYPVEKFYRDAKIGRIYEGTSNMQLMTIFKNLI